MNVLLEVKGLSVAYRKVQALIDLNLSVQAGQVVTVIGPNGAGKSTLLNALIGVLPSSGLLRFEGQDITRLSVEERVELGMCLVPEKRELFTEMSVEDNLYMGAFSRTRRKRIWRAIYRPSTVASRGFWSGVGSWPPLYRVGSVRCWPWRVR